jgi:Zn-dependent M28 family amino/carboxypeptidase
MMRFSAPGLALVLALALGASAGARTPPAAKLAAAPPPDPAAVAAALRDKALSDPTAWQTLESLTTEVGARPAGSPAAARARDWGLARLKALGFENVHAEPFPITAWARGAESAEVVSPYPQKLQILGIGGSAPTPPGGIEAEIVLFHTYAELLAAPEGSLAGKIAVVTQPMTRAQDAAGYSASSRWRTRGPGEAAKRGAVAYLLRSLSTAESRTPHTGAMLSEPRIPAAALSVPDAEQLDRMAARGGPIRIRLVLNSTTTPDAPAWNVVGEVRGSERPDEVVLIGGHLDSWDPGQGAIDDGAGVAITSSAARLIAQLPRHPRRTIRVVLFGDEEMDFSGKAYAAAHAAEASKIVAMGEADGGADPIWTLQLPTGGSRSPAMASLPRLMGPLKVIVSDLGALFAGSDMELQGVPPLLLRNDMSRYFDIHHSADDTLDKVDPEALAQNVAAWAAVTYLIADTDVDFRALAPPAPPK